MLSKKLVLGLEKHKGEVKMDGTEFFGLIVFLLVVYGTYNYLKKKK